MGIHLELRPRDSSTLTVALYLQRLLAAGCQPHPSSTHLEPDLEHRERYRDTLRYDQANVSVDTPGEGGGGASAFIRFSSCNTLESFIETLHALLDLSERVDAELLRNEPITRGGVEAEALFYVEAGKRIRKFFG